MFFSNAAFNKKSQGRFIIDTGATYVTLTQTFADKMGLATESSAEISVNTAGGLRPARLASVDRIDLQGATSEHVEVAVMKELPGDVDGMLGLSFLSRFDVRLAADQLEIKPRQPAVDARMH